MSTPPSIVTLNLHGIGTPVRDLEPGEDEVRVTLELEYELKERTFPLVDRFFVRRALQDALSRTLGRFGHERRAELDPVV